MKNRTYRAFGLQTEFQQTKIKKAKLQKDKPPKTLFQTALIQATLVLTLWGYSASSIEANTSALHVVFDDQFGVSEQPYVDRLKQEDALPMLLAFINDTVPFAQTLTLRIGADDGPLFDPATNEIWVPGEFLVEINQRFVNADLANTKQERNDVMLDVFTHTLLHEIAHAIIAQHNIPILGKEEDAADNLANVLILEYFENGDSLARNAANMFALEDEDTDTYYSEDFWDEHSLDIQRYFTTLCHIYGAQPEDNEDLIDAGELSEEKADSCIDEYGQISSDWLSVLDALHERQ